MGVVLNRWVDNKERSVRQLLFMGVVLNRWVDNKERSVRQLLFMGVVLIINWSSIDNKWE
jgi:hypothetical protein